MKQTHFLITCICMLFCSCSSVEPEKTSETLKGSDVSSAAAEKTGLVRKSASGSYSGMKLDHFHNTAWRTHIPAKPGSGNTLESILSGPNEIIRSVETDMRLNCEDILVAAHNNKVGGNCRNVRKKTIKQLKNCTLAKGYHVGTIYDLLSQPYDDIFIDLKNTDSSDEHIVVSALMSAADAVVSSGRQKDVVLMVYKIPPQLRTLIRKYNLRLGLKGYPRKRKQVKAMIKMAADNRMELICIKVEYISRRIIRKSAKQGIWVLGWDTGKNINKWKKLASWGLGGLINKKLEMVRDEVAPLWKCPY